MLQTLKVLEYNIFFLKLEQILAIIFEICLIQHVKVFLIYLFKLSFNL